MSNALRLLEAMCDAMDLVIHESHIYPDITRTERNYKVTKKPKAEKQSRPALKNEYTDEFDQAWQPYPKRVGNNSKIEAFRAFTARLNDGDNAQDIISGVNRYAAFIKATEKDNTEFVMMASTFFGPSNNFMQAWALPDIKKNILKLPYDNNDLEEFAVKHKLPKAGAGETYPLYKKRLQVLVDLINEG